MTNETKSFQSFQFTGLALDPIHVGTGGSKLGRVDNTIVRDPVTKIPKIPGSSLAGVTRAYVAMAKGKYDTCAGQGQPKDAKGHCGDAICPVCTTFGFAKGDSGGNGGFAGLASFSDMHVLLFPVASGNGPQWVTSPMALETAGIKNITVEDQEAAYTLNGDTVSDSLNLGWLYLKNKAYTGSLDLNNLITKLPETIQKNILLVSDKLFGYIVNSNLEVRTSVAINPATGAAEEKALFTYEALPRGTVLFWEVTCKNPAHFRINGKNIGINTPEGVKDIVIEANEYLKNLGIGGMGTRGMGRLQVFDDKNDQPCNSEQGGA